MINFDTIIQTVTVFAIPVLFAISLHEAVWTLIGTGWGAVAALALMAASTALVRRVGWAIALRVAGSWLAAIAMLVLALRWRG